MKLIIRHLFRDLDKYYVTNFFNILYNTIQQYYPQYSFEIFNDKKYENNGYGGLYSCMNFSILNPETEKYILLSFFDNWKYLFMQHMGWKPSKMTQFFYAGGFNYADYFNFRNHQKDNPDLDIPLNIDHLYNSFFYGPYYTGYDHEVNNLYRKSSKNSIPILTFRGYMWDFRQLMVQDLFEDQSINIVDKNTGNNALQYIDYLKDLTKYRCALSLPGGTEICNRDIECFSVGVPVIRPLISTAYPDPLIPNYHYISCYDNCKYWDGNPSYLSYVDFQRSLIECWHRVKDNIDYLDFIAKNAREWYLRNSIIDNNIKYTISKIDLGALDG